MEVEGYTIVYETHVVREDIPHLSETNKKRIKKAIENKLRFNPETFGKPLRRSLKGYRKLRVGGYRVIFRIQGKMVKIFAILKRSVVYNKSEKRIL